MNLRIYKKITDNPKFGVGRDLVVFFLDYEPTSGYISGNYSNKQEYFELNPLQLRESPFEFDSGDFREYQVSSDSAVFLTLELFNILSENPFDRQVIAKTLELILKESSEVK